MAEIDLTWSPSTDNVAVAGYRIRRDTVIIATVDASTTSYHDVGLSPLTTYHYTVQAFDASGNYSGESASVAATTGTNPAPILSSRLWGISPSNNGGFVPSISTQIATFLDLGINCPRIPGDTTFSNALRAAGFTKWVAWISGDGSATPAQAVTYAQNYPEAVIVGIGNELNLSSSWTVEQVATKQIAFYNAMVAVGLQNRVGLSCIGNSPSSSQGLLPLDWCKHLRTLGCVKGTGFTFADYHMYSANPQSYDNWMHVWTPLSGESCQSVLGHPQFVITEMGAKIGRDVSDATAQANAATAWVQKLASLSECQGGMWFQAYDGSSWAGYGLIDGSGTHRPSYNAFKAAIAAA